MTFTVRTAKIYTLTFNYFKDTFISCSDHTTLQADNGDAVENLSIETSSSFRSAQIWVS